MHLTCLRPALAAVPEGDWFCAACMAVQRREAATTAREDEVSRHAVSALEVQQPAAAPPPSPVELRGVPVEDVEVSKYLGCFISSDGRLKKELSHRIGAAAGAFRTLSQVWSSHHIRLHTKGKLYRAAVLSNLLYGAESWNVSKSHTQQLHAFHMSCLRRIVGITRLERVSNAEVLRRCGQHAANANTTTHLSAAVAGSSGQDGRHTPTKEDAFRQAGGAVAKGQAAQEVAGTRG